MTLRISRKVRSKTVTYLVLPQAFKTDSLDEALAERQDGQRVVEYTLIVKDIFLRLDNRPTAHAKGEYLQSRDIK